MITEFKLSDLDLLNKFLNENLLEEYTEKFLKNNIFIKFVGILDNHKIKALLVYSIYYDRIEIDNIAVSSSFRHKGLASSLMSFLTDFASKEKIKNITLEVNVNNIEAISLYKKFGFKIAAVRKNYYGKDDGYLMIRSIV